MDIMELLSSLFGPTDVPYTAPPVAPTPVPKADDSRLSDAGGSLLGSPPAWGPQMTDAGGGFMGAPIIPPSLMPDNTAGWDKFATAGALPNLIGRPSIDGAAGVAQGVGDAVKAYMNTPANLLSLFTGGTKTLPGVAQPSPEKVAAQTFGLPAAFAQAAGGGRDVSTIIPSSLANGSLPNEKKAPSYVDTVAQLESANDADAQNPKSSALGLGQFTDGTWLDMIKKYRPELAEGQSKEQILALRHDPTLSKDMIQKYGDENGAYLEKNGLPSTNATKYAAHLLGPGGAVAVMKAPFDTPIKDVIGEKAYTANLNNSGRFVYGDTTGEVMQTIMAKTDAHPGTNPGAMPGPARLQTAVLPAGPQRQAMNFPDAPITNAPQLPGAPRLQAEVAPDYSRAEATATQAKPTIAPITRQDKLLNVLRNMSSGAVGAKSWGDVLAGAGGSMGKAATGYEDLERQRNDLMTAKDLPDFYQKLAVMQKSVADKMAEGTNKAVDARNTNTVNADARAVEQEKANTAAKNKTEETKYARDVAQEESRTGALNYNTESLDSRMVKNLLMAKDTANENTLRQAENDAARFKASLPNVTHSDKGYTLQQLNPNTGETSFTTKSWDDLDRQIKMQSQLKTAFGANSQEAQANRYMYAAKNAGAAGLKREMLKDVVERFAPRDILTKDQYGAFTKEIDASLPQKMQGNDKAYKDAWTERGLDILMKMQQSGSLKDSTWIPKLYEQGNLGAKLLMMGNAGS